jgi:hypothetical protein
MPRRAAHQRNTVWASQAGAVERRRAAPAQRDGRQEEGVQPPRRRGLEGAFVDDPGVEASVEGVPQFLGRGRVQGPAAVLDRGAVGAPPPLDEGVNALPVAGDLGAADQLPDVEEGDAQLFEAGRDHKVGSDRAGLLEQLRMDGQHVLELRDLIKE